MAEVYAVGAENSQKSWLTKFRFEHVRVMPYRPEDYEPYLRRPSESKPKNLVTQRPKPYERPTLHPVSDRAEFLRRLKMLNRQPKQQQEEYQNNGGAVIAFGYERSFNELQPKLRAAEIEQMKERQRKAVEETPWLE